VIRRLWGQLRAIWDISRDLVEVRERIDALNDVQGELRSDVTRIDERTRKQEYREKKAVEDATWRAATAADPGVSRAEILRRARERGLA